MDVEAEVEAERQTEQEEDEVELSHHTDQSFGKVDTLNGTESENEQMVHVDAPNNSPPGNVSLKSAENAESKTTQSGNHHTRHCRLKSTPRTYSRKGKKENREPNQPHRRKTHPNTDYFQNRDAKRVDRKERNTGGALSAPMEIDHRGKRERGGDVTSKEDLGGKKNKEKEADGLLTVKPLKEMWHETAQKHQADKEEKEKKAEEKRPFRPKEKRPFHLHPKKKRENKWGS